jgi:hypothetical protein
MVAILGLGLVLQSSDVVDLWFQSQGRSKLTVVSRGHCVLLRVADQDRPDPVRCAALDFRVGVARRYPACKHRIGACLPAPAVRRALALGCRRRAQPFEGKLAVHARRRLGRRLHARRPDPASRAFRRSPAGPVLGDPSAVASVAHGADDRLHEPVPPDGHAETDQSARLREAVAAALHVDGLERTRRHHCDRRLCTLAGLDPARCGLCRGRTGPEMARVDETCSCSWASPRA